MLNRRDVVSIVFYGLLFAAVVLWAELRTTNLAMLAPHETTRAEMLSSQIASSGDQPEMRRLLKHTKIP